MGGGGRKGVATEDKLNIDLYNRGSPVPASRPALPVLSIRAPAGQAFSVCLTSLRLLVHTSFFVGLSLANVIYQQITIQKSQTTCVNRKRSLPLSVTHTVIHLEKKSVLTISLLKLILIIFFKRFHHVLSC